MDHLRIVNLKKPKGKLTPEEKLKKIKGYAHRELNQFDEIMKKMNDFSENSILYGDIFQLMYIQLEEFNNTAVLPIVKGKRPKELTEEEFLAVRAELFNELFERYRDFIDGN